MINFHYKIFEHDKYNYIVTKDYSLMTNVIDQTVEHAYFELRSDGYLTIKKGYAWDGATHAIDTKDILRGSLVHDALYQMLQEKLIPKDEKQFNRYFKLANKELLAICKEDGMSWFRRTYIYYAVQWFGRSHARPKN